MGFRILTSTPRVVSWMDFEQIEERQSEDTAEMTMEMVQ